MRVYTHVDAVLGPKRSFTPEGFLYCEDVPLARTGEQIYYPHEIEGLPAGQDGLIHVMRDAADVFTPNALASFVGKPVTDDHPPNNLTPITWREHTRGVILNPRRGTGDQADLMVGDLLIQDKDAIAAIMDGKREVSCGYTAEYEILGPGRARQYDIIGNHTALVPQGRCGGRCAIGDHSPMPTVSAVKIGKVTLKDRLRKMMDEGDDGDDTGGGDKTEHHVHVNIGGAGAPGKEEKTETDEEKAEREKMEAAEAKDRAPLLKLMSKMSDSMDGIAKRLAKLEARDAKGEDDDDEEDETKEEKEEREAREKRASERDAKDRRRAKDGRGAASAVVLDAAAVPAAIQDLAARAELLVPGIRLPAMDAKADPKIVTDTICMQRRSVLTTAGMLPKSAEALLPLMAGQPAMDRMTCDQVGMLFIAASEAMRNRNNSMAGGGGGGGIIPAGGRKVGDQLFSGPVTPAEINARNQHFNSTVRNSGVR